MIETKKRPKISMVILCHNANDRLEQITLDAIKSYRPEVDEMIVTDAGGRFSKKIMMASDVYLFGKENIGFTANANRGWKVSSGEYTMIINNDTFLVKGSLHDLCIPNKVTSPIIVNQHIAGLAGPFWVVPRNITEERGYLLEEMKTYSSDEDYAKRVEDIFQKVKSVEIFHLQQQTVKTLGIEGGAEAERDNKIYEELKKQGKAS